MDGCLDSSPFHREQHVLDLLHFPIPPGTEDFVVLWVHQVHQDISQGLLELDHLVAQEDVVEDQCCVRVVEHDR